MCRALFFRRLPADNGSSSHTAAMIAPQAGRDHNPPRTRDSPHPPPPSTDADGVLSVGRNRKKPSTDAESSANVGRSFRRHSPHTQRRQKQNHNPPPTLSNPSVSAEASTDTHRILSVGRNRDGISSGIRPKPGGLLTNWLRSRGALRHQFVKGMRRTDLGR